MLFRYILTFVGYEKVLKNLSWESWKVTDFLSVKKWAWFFTSWVMPTKSGTTSWASFHSPLALSMYCTYNISNINDELITL